MYLLSLLLSLMVSTHVCVAASDSQTHSSSSNFTPHPNDSMTTHRPNKVVAENTNARKAIFKGLNDAYYNYQGSGSAEFETVGSIACENCVDYGSGTVNVHENLIFFSGSGSFQTFVCESCMDSGYAVFTPVGCKGQECTDSGSGTVNVHEQDFDSFLYEECKDGHCYSGFDNNAESEESSYSGSVFTFVGCTGDECSDSGSGSSECRDRDCGLPEVTDISVYEKNGCGHGAGLVQWMCAYLDNGEIYYCYNATRCYRAALPEREVCDWWGDCRYVDREDFTAMYNWCEYGRKHRDQDVCYLMTALQKGDGYTLCEYSDGINTEPARCGDFVASEYCTITQPSTNRLTHTTIPIIVYITGLLLNHLILLVLAWKAEATVTNCLLKLLAVWDSLYLVCQLLEWAVWMQTGDVLSVIKDVGYVWVDVGCYLEAVNYIQVAKFCQMMRKWQGADVNVSTISKFLTHLPHMYYVAMYWLHTAARLFQLMSVYQTVIIACFRYIAIQFPFQADKYLTYTTAWLATLGCLVVAGLLHVPNVIGGVTLHTATSCENKYKRGLTDEFEQCFSKITNNNHFYSTSDLSFRTFFHIYYVIFYHIVMFFALPSVILLVLNTLMLRELWRGSQTQENIAVTRVVVAIISVFLISYSVKPFYIIDIFYFDGSLLNSIALSSCGTYFSMSVLILILPCLNSSVNFLIYVGFRESFRRQFLSMFDWCWKRCPCHCKQQAAV